METRIVLFDDNAKIRKSLELMINGYDDFVVVNSFPDYTNVLENIHNSNADLVIMDIEIPPKDGIEAVELIRKSKNPIPILMFTVFEDDDKIFRSVCAGAQGYLLKSASPEDIMDALRELRKGGAPMTPTIARKILKKFSETVIVNTSKDDYNLTKRELEILRLLTEANSYKAVADRLVISYETVRTHIRNIYVKLHVASMTEAVTKAINEKLIK